MCLQNFNNFFSDVRNKLDFNIFQPFVYQGNFEEASTSRDKNAKEGMIQFFVESFRSEYSIVLDP